MRCLPTSVQVARGPAWIVLRSRGRRRTDQTVHLWPLERFLCRSDREEAAQSFPAGLERAVLRDGWLQFGLQILFPSGHSYRDDAWNAAYRRFVPAMRGEDNQ